MVNQIISNYLDSFVGFLNFKSARIASVFFFLFLLFSISFSADCGDGIKPCDCGDTVVANYTMTSDLVCPGTGLIIGADNITLDCNGRSIIFSNSLAARGVDISNHNFTKIKNCKILQQNSSISGTVYGIYLSASFNNLIENNNISLTKFGYGVYLSSSSFNNLSLNNISSNDYYGVYIVNSNSNNFYLNYILSNGFTSLLLSNAISNNFSFNNITSLGYYGISLSGGSVNKFTSNKIIGYYDGVYISGSSYSNNLFNNTIEGGLNYAGIHFSQSTSNIVSNNYIRSPTTGVYLQLSSSNNILFNNIINSTTMGYIADSSLNFWNTTLNCSAGSNIVGGSCIGGNFYATPSGTGFSQTCTDSDGNGICDSSFTINSNNIDYLPITYPPPSLDCGSLTEPGKTYTLTQNVSSPGTCFTIAADNITLDCNGFTISTSGNNGIGVYMNGRNNVTIKNCIIDGNYSGTSSYYIYGIHAQYSSNLTLQNNTLFDNFNGIFLEYSSSNNISGNNASNNGNYGIFLQQQCNNNIISDNYASNNNYGNIFIAWYSNNNRMINNTVFNSIYGLLAQYYINNVTISNNTIYSINGNGIDLNSASDSLISNNNISGNTANGIYSSSGSNIIFENNELNNNYRGIWLMQTTNSNISNNTINNSNEVGVRVESGSNYNRFASNSIFGGTDGFHVYSSSFNTVIYNNITFNSNGIFLESTAYYNDVLNNSLINSTINGILIMSSNNTVSNNTITSNSSCNGIAISSASNNTISNNTISNLSGYSIVLTAASNNSIINNKINLSTSTSIYLSFHSDYNIINNNTITNTSDGVFIGDSSNNSISNNTISVSTNYGISLSNSFNNSIFGNTVAYCANGIVFEDSSSDNLFFNNYLYNSNNVYFITTNLNFWNTTLNCSAGPNIVGGSCIGGNFWATPSGTGYSQTCTDLNSDGICDSQFTIDSNNVDYLPLAYPSIYLNSCGTIDQAGRTYILNQTVGESGTCFTITANNITLDCNNYNISYASTTSGYGIWIDANFTTIKNCKFIQASENGAGYQGAIYIYSGSNHTISNNNFTTIGAPSIHNPSGASGNTISGNTMTINQYGSNTPAAIHFSTYPSNDNTIINNTIITHQAGSGIAIYQGGSNNVIAKNVIITNASAAHGIVLINVTDSSVTNNSVRTYAGNLHLIRVQDSHDNNISFNNLTCFGDAGTLGVAPLRLYGSSHHNTLSDNTVRINCSGAGGAGALRLGESVSNNTFLRNYVVLNAANSTGIRIGTNSSMVVSDNLFTNNTIVINNSQNTSAIRITNNSQSNRLVDTVINNTVEYATYFATDSTSTSNNITNTTIRRSNGSVNYLQQLSIPAGIAVSSSHINIYWSSALNSSFIYLNTSNSSVNDFLNKSAHITLYGLSFTNAQPIVDFNDDGVFEVCSAPQCANISYNSTTGTLEFDVASFSTYAAEEVPSDTSPPSVQILSPSNNTWHKSNVTISFIAIDDMSTIINCTFFDNGSNKGSMNITNNTLTNVSPILTNAKHDIYLNCSDQAGNSNISNLITIYFDNIAPEVSFTLSSTVVYVGDTLTYNCTATDNSESYGGSVNTAVTGIDTSSAGTKTARCTATDTAGNSYYVERTYTVNQVYVPPTGGGGGTSCSPIWQCSEWSECSKDGIRTRTCIDINNCGTTIDKPAEIAACIYACMPDWQCSAWTECSPEGLQTRTCTDRNNCGFTSPSTSRSCLYIPKQLTAEADQTDLNSISAIQSNFVNLFQSLENNNYNEVESYFSSAIDHTNFLLRTSPTQQNLNISQIVIDNGLKLSDLLIQQEQSSSSSNILSNISSTLPFLASIDASYANNLANRLIQKSSLFFAASRPDELVSFLNPLIQSLKDSSQSQFRLIDELQRSRLDPDSLLKLNELGTSVQTMTSALSDLDDASEIILQASMEPNSEKKFQLSSQSLNLIQQSMLKFPEINRILSYSVDQEPSEITYQTILTSIPEDEKIKLEEMKNSTDSETLTAMKSVFSYSVKNEEYTDKETEVTIVKLSVISPSQLDNLTIYEYIPKGISVSDIQSTYNFTILNEDPVIQFNLGSAAIGETKSITYTINKKLPSYSSQSYSIGLIHTGIPYLPTPEEIVFSDSTHNIRILAAVLITAFILLEFYLTRKSESTEFRLFKRETIPTKDNEAI